MIITEKNGKESAGTSVGLFRTALGLRVVDSPTRTRILGLLGEGELSFEEIVTRTGRAKSTISVHLRELVADGVLAARTDPDDGRRKFFYVDSEYLCRLSDAERLEADVGRLLADYDPLTPDPFTFYRTMFRSIRVTLLADGVNIDPILNAAGTHLGRRLARAFAGTSTEDLLEALRRFWDQHGLGRLSVASTEPLVIEIHDCFECVDLPYLGRSACAFDCGILSAVFGAHFDDGVRVVETACYAMGDGVCRFEIDALTILELDPAPAT